MTIRDAKGKIEDKIKVENVLVSVFDKDGLEYFVPGIMETNPGVRFISTGGTHKKLKEILGDKAENSLIEVAEYTGFPEMEGGLVKTLHPKIHAGILGERNNPDHQKYLKDMGGDYIDMVVINLYPFRDVIAKQDATFETARGHIDIGGPTMLRAAAKNFLGCCPVPSTINYRMVLRDLKKNNGSTTLNLRLSMADEVFRLTAGYDKAIARYFDSSLSEKIFDIHKGYGL